MSAIPMLIVLLFVVAAFALIWWGFSRIAIPEPIKTIILVIIGLVMLYVLYSAVSTHHVAITS